MAPHPECPDIFDDATRGEYKQSGFRSIMLSKAHRRNLSADDAPTIPRSLLKNKYIPPVPFFAAGERRTIPEQHPLGEIAPNRDSPDGLKQTNQATEKQERHGLHQKKKSAVSLKSLRSYMDRDRRDHKPEDNHDENSAEWKPKKAKSSNSLSAILKRSQRSRRAEASKDVRDKENRSPVDPVDNTPTSPVWPQSVEQPFREHLAGPFTQNRRTLAEEMSIYTPKGYSPAQQRNFYDYYQPSLTRRTEAKPRPKSDCISGHQMVKDFVDSRTKSCPVEPAANPSSRGPERRRKTTSESRPETEKKQDASPKKQSRVQAAISAFNAREQEAELQKRLNSKDIESEFEKLLVCKEHFWNAHLTVRKTNFMF